MMAARTLIDEGGGEGKVSLDSVGKTGIPRLGRLSEGLVASKESGEYWN